MDNRHGLAVGGRVTQATSYAEREAAIELLAKTPGAGRATLGADKAYDMRGFVETLRFLRVTPHIAAKVWYGSIDGRTTRHPGERRIGWTFVCTLAVHNLVRLRTLQAASG
jgi:hypothetical protein